MNIVYLVESGKYDPEQIEGEWWRGYVAGRKAAFDAAEGFACEYDDPEGAAEHERVYNSIAREVAVHAAEFQYADYCEAVVSALDDEAAEKMNAVSADS